MADPLEVPARRLAAACGPSDTERARCTRLDATHADYGVAGYRTPRATAYAAVSAGHAVRDLSVRASALNLR